MTKKVLKETVKRPKTQAEIMLRRLRFAKSSQAIEGLELTCEQFAAFEECINDGYSSTKLTEKLKKLSTCYAKSLLY